MPLHLSRLQLEGYKAFGQPCEIEIRPLTIIVGANNAWKSALARAVPLLAGGLQIREPSANAVPLPLSSFGLTHGDSFEELIAGRSLHGSVRLEADFRGSHQELTFTVVVQNVVSPGLETRQVVSRWTLTMTGGQQVDIERLSLDSSRRSPSDAKRADEATHDHCHRRRRRQAQGDLPPGSRRKSDVGELWGQCPHNSPPGEMGRPQ